MGNAQKRPSARFWLCLFLAELFVDALRAELAGAHGEDDGGSARDGVAAGVDACVGGEALLVDDDAALAVDLKARGGVLDET